MSELKWFFIILVVMFVFWSITGGATRVTKPDPFLEQPSPIEGGQTYNLDQLKERDPQLFPGR